MVGWHERDGVGRFATVANDIESCLQLGEAEVENLDPSVVCDIDVGGLDVAMDDPLGVGGGKPRRNLGRDVEHARAAQRAGGQILLERLSLQQLHGDKRLSVLLASFVDRADVRMVQRGGRARLVQEPIDRGSIVRDGRRQQFDGDLPLEGDVLGPVDDTHPPGPQLIADAVVRECLPDH